MASESTPLTTATSASTTRSPRFRQWGLVLFVAIATTVLVTMLWPTSITDGQNKPSHVRVVNAEAPATFPGAADEILNLPGKPVAYTSRLFSGYLPVANGGEGFYFLAESQSETPQTDPVLLWLNGGPGASSLEGCFSENGPLLVNADGTTLRVNEYGWNKHTNLVCIESPIGVGFSYNASGIYKSDDDAQADDLYWMLQSFFDKFPWLRQNDFIIAGESYGGIYVPTTAKRIVEGNAEFQDDASRQIKLKKFAVGNGVNEYMKLSRVVFAYTHALISTDQYVAVAKNCPELLIPGTLLSANRTAGCEQAISAVDDRLNSEQVNPYGIYGKCVLDSSDDSDDLSETLLGPPIDPPHPMPLSGGTCEDGSPEFTYFNLPKVRETMHANPDIKTWGDALTTANFRIEGVLPNATSSEIKAIIKNKLLDYSATYKRTVTPFWTYLINHSVEGVIYHGDTDTVCDFLGGLWAVESLNLPRLQPRSTWFVPGDDQVAGFVEDFGHIKYVTVKGAGHLVPTDKPQEALAMLNLFILN